jgi:hypothetical protein
MAALELARRIIFDTAVFIDAANGAVQKGPLSRRIPPSDWSKAIAHVNRTCVHAISPYTVAELFTGIANSDPQSFSQKKVALTKLRSGFSALVHLPYTKFFTLREVFGMAAPCPANLEDDFGAKIDIVLGASLDDLNKIRFFDSFLSDRKFQFDCARAQGERIQKNNWKLTREKWLSGLLVSLELAGTAEQLSALDERLDACYYWDDLCYQKARNKSCDLDKVAKMFYDLSQLNFLAAADVLFVTRDGALVRAIAKSRQAGRVMLWEAFLQHACDCLSVFRPQGRNW